MRIDAYVYYRAVRLGYVVGLTVVHVHGCTTTVDRLATWIHQKLQSSFNRCQMTEGMSKQPVI